MIIIGGVGAEEPCNVYPEVAYVGIELPTGMLTNYEVRNCLYFLGQNLLHLVVSAGVSWSSNYFSFSDTWDKCSRYC